MTQASEITAQGTELTEPVELVYREAMQERDHRKVIGKVTAAIPVLRERLRQIDPQPWRQVEKRHLALELQALQIRRQLAARCCPGCWLRADFDATP
jgi:hypothetical protein